MVTCDKPDNLVELIETRVAQYGERPLFGTPDHLGNYTWVTYDAVGKRINDLRAGLARMGISNGDTIGIIARNRVEWAVAAFATFGLGGRFIPMYEKELPKIWRYIIQDGGIKVLFVANIDVYKQIEILRPEAPRLKHVFIIDGNEVENMADLEEKGRYDPVPSIRPGPEDIAVLLYTSGTTGNPKGVLLSHGNFTSNFIAGGRMFPELSCESRSLSILPWAHSYGQTAELYNFINIGAAIGFMRDVSTLAEDMGKVAPTFLIAVPRIFNKIYAGLWAKMNDAGGLARKLFIMGLKSAAENRRLAARGKRAIWPQFKYKLADRIVFSKIRQRFGGCLKGTLTASAMMNMEVARFFTDIGMPVFDAYGLTETSPAVTMNNRTANRSGSVGRPIDQVRVVIDPSRSDGHPDEGEVVVYGPNVMQGYHNNPDATKKVMTADGGFRTGDVGRLDEDGFLFITGRIKEQYKLENGKYVFPAALEEEIQLSPWVENVLIYGEGHRHNVCLIIPDFHQLKVWARDKGIGGDPKALIADPQVKAKISQVITDHLKNKFKGYEIPRSYILDEEPFSIENGMLTQTLKLKRRKVVERYWDQIETSYETA